MQKDELNLGSLNNSAVIHFSSKIEAKVTEQQIQNKAKYTALQWKLC